MELLILGVLLGAGAAKRKSVTKALVKGYMAVKDTSSHLKADMQAAIQEAKSSHELEASEFDDPSYEQKHAEMTALHEEAASEIAVAVPAMKIYESINHQDKPPTGAASNGATEDNLDEVPHPKPALTLLKSMAKSYVKVSEMTRTAAAHVREDIRDAVEEARYEREMAATKAAALPAPEETAVPESQPSTIEAEVKPAPRRKAAVRKPATTVEASTVSTSTPKITVKMSTAGTKAKPAAAKPKAAKATSESATAPVSTGS